MNECKGSIVGTKGQPGSPRLQKRRQGALGPLREYGLDETCGTCCHHEIDKTKITPAVTCSLTCCITIAPHLHLPSVSSLYGLFSLLKSRQLLSILSVDNKETTMMMSWLRDEGVRCLISLSTHSWLSIFPPPDFKCGGLTVSFSQCLSSDSSDSVQFSWLSCLSFCLSLLRYAFPLSVYAWLCVSLSLISNHRGVAWSDSEWKSFNSPHMVPRLPDPGASAPGKHTITASR